MLERFGGLKMAFECKCGSTRSALDAAVNAKNGAFCWSCKSVTCIAVFSAFQPKYSSAGCGEGCIVALGKKAYCYRMSKDFGGEMEVIQAAIDKPQARMPEQHKCKCALRDLMACGCKCGGI